GVGDVNGNGGVTPLTNGNYVVCSSLWDNPGLTLDVGAITLGSGMGGADDVVTAVNSLIGTTAGDRVSIGLATALSNGNYLVSSPNWKNGSASAAGAVTFGDGTTLNHDTVNDGNSLVGGSANDSAGSGGITAFTNGNYVVSSPLWDNGSLTD